MTTVKQLKEYLDTLPDETEVRVAIGETRGYSAYTTFTSLDLEDHADFVDLTGNKWAKDTPREGSKFLFLGLE